MVAGLRRQDWAFFAMMFCAGGLVVSAASGDRPIVPLTYGFGAVTAAVLARRWSRLYPAPMPYRLRWILYLSHPGLSPRALHRVLVPRPGERMLEIGPGIGHHALPTAEALGPRGRLVVLDVQPEMLTALGARVERRGVTNLVAAQGDAERLPYEAATFDAAYLITVLGEIPHPEIALRELGRVVKPGGRIVVGELFLDPDYVSPSRMGALASSAGLVFGTQSGGRDCLTSRGSRCVEQAASDRCRSACEGPAIGRVDVGNVTQTEPGAACGEEGSLQEPPRELGDRKRTRPSRRDLPSP
ncbi:MAG: class I SAM-dependent methyltransferase, partial [Candidatus Binatia bacterium]